MADDITLTSRLHVALAAIEEDCAILRLMDDRPILAQIATSIEDHCRALREKCAQHDAAHAASTAEARLTALVERLEAVEHPDTKRLNWLAEQAEERNGVEISFTDSWMENGEYGSILSSGPREFWLNDDGVECGPTIRDAIDAAMQARADG